MNNKEKIIKKLETQKSMRDAVDYKIQELEEQPNYKKMYENIIQYLDTMQIYDRTGYEVYAEIKKFVEKQETEG